MRAEFQPEALLLQVIPSLALPVFGSLLKRCSHTQTLVLNAPTQTEAFQVSFGNGME